MLRLFTRPGVRCVQCLRPQNTRSLAKEADDEGQGQPLRYEKSVNQVNLLGRVGRDAELRGSDAHPVCVFSLATNNTYTKADGTSTSRVDWHRVSVFKPGLREKVAINIKKGDRVYVTGVLRYDEYTDNEENVVRTTTILANDLVNLTKRYLHEEEKEEGVGKGF